jgi:glycosyltransferase involved in cell wall biosynthesis
VTKQKLQLRLAFITAIDPNDRKSWSGIYSFMLDELKNEFEHIEVIGPIPQPFLLKVLLGGIAVFHLAAFNMKYDKLRSSVLSRYYGRIIAKKLKKSPVDVIFAPAASTEIANLNTSIPICYYSDSSFAQISNYYADYKGISDRSKLESNQIEKKAIQRSAACVYSSLWAADFASNYYHKPINDVFVAKFGANITPLEKIDINYKDKSIEFNILFLGVDWYRKGGEKVVAVYNSLKNKGYPVTLTICGSNPNIKDENITIFPFLDKNKKEDRKILQDIMLRTHLMLLPTEADCSPIVLNEAAAFGIPVIATDTGGIASQVEHGFNGFLVTNEKDFYQYSELLINDQELYLRMAENALEKYKNELNWSKWGEEIKSIIHVIALKSN